MVLCLDPLLDRDLRLDVDLLLLLFFDFLLGDLDFRLGVLDRLELFRFGLGLERRLELDFFFGVTLRLRLLCPLEDLFLEVLDSLPRSLFVDRSSLFAFTVGLLDLRLGDSEPSRLRTEPSRSSLGGEGERDTDFFLSRDLDLRRLRDRLLRRLLDLDLRLLNALGGVLDFFFEWDLLDLDRRRRDRDGDRDLFLSLDLDLFLSLDRDLRLSRDLDLRDLDRRLCDFDLDPERDRFRGVRDRRLDRDRRRDRDRFPRDRDLLLERDRLRDLDLLRPLDLDRELDRFFLYFRSFPPAAADIRDCASLTFFMASSISR